VRHGDVFLKVFTSLFSKSDRRSNAPRVGSTPPFEKGGRKLSRRHRREVPDKSKFEKQ
jgi:hypothetical protein